MLWSFGNWFKVKNNIVNNNSENYTYTVSSTSMPITTGSIGIAGSKGHPGTPGEPGIRWEDIHYVCTLKCGEKEIKFTCKELDLALTDEEKLVLIEKIKIAQALGEL